MKKYYDLKNYFLSMCSDCCSQPNMTQEAQSSYTDLNTTGENDNLRAKIIPTPG